MKERIRRPTVDDAPAMGRVAASAWRTAYTGLMPAELIERMDEPARTRRFSQYLSDPENVPRTWVFEDGGAVVGYATTGPSRDEDAADGEAELYAIYFLPEVWGRGLGRALLEHALDDLRARGFRAVEVWVLTANHRARAFYERTGFTLDLECVVKELLGHELPHARYRKELG